MNIEFVYIILLGIKMHIESTPQVKDTSIINTANIQASSKNAKIRIENSKSQSKVEFCDMKIEDIKRWMV